MFSATRWGPHTRRDGNGLDHPAMDLGLRNKRAAVAASTAGLGPGHGQGPRRRGGARGHLRSRPGPSRGGRRRTRARDVVAIEADVSTDGGRRRLRAPRPSEPPRRARHPRGQRRRPSQRQRHAPPRSTATGSAIELNLLSTVAMAWPPCPRCGRRAGDASSRSRRSACASPSRSWPRRSRPARGDRLPQDPGHRGRRRRRDGELDPAGQPPDRPAPRACTATSSRRCRPTSPPASSATRPTSAPRPRSSAASRPGSSRAPRCSSTAALAAGCSDRESRLRVVAEVAGLDQVGPVPKLGGGAVEGHPPLAQQVRPVGDLEHQARRAARPRRIPAPGLGGDGSQHRQQLLDDDRAPGRG